MKTAAPKLPVESKQTYVRAAYAYNTDVASRASAAPTSSGPGAKQEFASECDINTIVRNFGVTGQVPTSVRRPHYGDFSNVGDFREALHAIKEAEESFAAMPSGVRERFHNNAAAFVDFCSNPANKDEFVKLGLVDAPLPAPTPEPVPEAPKAA